MPIREQQTTNKQHAIPQSIMSVEFKIIGDLTLKQFIFLLIFCGLAYTSFMLVQIFIFKWLLVIFFVIVGLAFAFLPLGDRGLDVWIVNFLKAMLLPNQFVYRKQEEIPNVFLYQNIDVLRSELITLTPTSSRRKIEAYLEQQETPFDKLDIDEKSYILKVKEAYSSGYAGFSSSSVTTMVAPSVPVMPQAGTVLPETEAPQQPQPTTTAASSKPAEIPHVQNLAELELPPPKAWQPQPAASTPAPVAAPAPQGGQDSIIKSELHTQASSTHYQRPKSDHKYYSPSMTPDMHTGRRFIDLTEEAGRGEIILPIRGERVLRSADSTQFDQNEAEKEYQKVKQLDELINQIKSKEAVQKQLIESQKIKAAEEVKQRERQEQTQQAKQAELVRLDAENRRIQEQARLEAEKHRAEEERARDQAAKEQERLQKLRDQEAALNRQKEGLLTKVQLEPTPRPPEATVRPEPQAIPLKVSQLEESPSMPNLVWGVVVTNYQGHQVPVPAVVVVIRNQRKEVVRAVKTSAQGRFSITTPLINGLYTIEVDREHKSGLTFDLAGFEAKGEPIHTVEIVGKA
jgi:hypothetical protein